MKNVFVFCILLTLCISVYSQDDVYFDTSNKSQIVPQHHFKIEGSKVIWQKVYNYADTVNIRDIIIEKNILTDIIETNQKLIGRLKPSKIDFKSYGYSRINIPIYIGSSDFSGDFSIESKDNRYRVTISNIVFIDNVTGGILKKGNETNYEIYAVNRKGAFRDIFYKYDVVIFENALNALIEAKLNNSDTW